MPVRGPARRDNRPQRGRCADQLLTNSGVDVTDLYLEKVTGEGYQYGGKVVPFTSREETIKVAGGESRKIVVRETNNGPLLSDRSKDLVRTGKKATVDSAAPDRGDGYGVSLRWTALDAGRTMDSVFAINRAKDWDDFREAATLFEVPSQNLVYADTEGHIGYTLPGRIPPPGEGPRRFRPGARLELRVQVDRLGRAGRTALRVRPRPRLHRHRPTRPSSIPTPTRTP
ncbi:penicillin acylase family protein [Streptomyces sp. H-KF8]|uniref:penicillin acylase family protein n=1 Tax=Streptomyces sp. H-KF8 TaxID=1727216 RepID=UPI003B638D2C